MPDSGPSVRMDLMTTEIGRVLSRYLQTHTWHPLQPSLCLPLAFINRHIAEQHTVTT